MILKKKLISKKSESLFVLYKFLKMIFFAILFFNSFLLCLYISGNFQSFSTESQSLILSILSHSSIFLILFAILMIIGNIIFIVKGIVSIKSRILSMFIYFMCLILGIVFMVISELVILASKGF